MPSLMAVTVLEELQRRHPGRFADAVLRTLQRRVSQWRAEHSDEREIPACAPERHHGHGVCCATCLTRRISTVRDASSTR